MLSARQPAPHNGRCNPLTGALRTRARGFSCVPITKRPDTPWRSQSAIGLHCLCSDGKLSSPKGAGVCRWDVEGKTQKCFTNWKPLNTRDDSETGFTQLSQHPSHGSTPPTATSMLPGPPVVTCRYARHKRHVRHCARTSWLVWLWSEVNSCRSRAIATPKPSDTKQTTPFTLRSVGSLSPKTRTRHDASLQLI